MINQPFSTAVTYIELLCLCLSLTIHHILSTVYFKKMRLIRVHKSIFLVFSTHFVIFLSELICTIISYYYPQDATLFNFFNTVCYCGMFLAPLFWIVFCEKERESFISRIKQLKIFLIIVPIVFCILSALYVWNGIVFFLNKNAVTHRSQFSIWLVGMSFFYYALSAFVALYRIFVEKDRDDKAENDKMMLFFSVPLLVAITIQFFTNEKVALTGYMFSSTIVFITFVVGNSFRQRLKEETDQYSEIILNDKRKIQKIESERLNESINRAKNAEVIRSLAEDFIFVCYVNLTTNETTRYHEIPQITQIFDSFPSNMFSFEMLDLFLKRVVLPEDFERIHKKALNPKAVASLLAEGKTTEEFQANIDGEYKYYRLKLAVDKDNPNGVIYGIYSIDEIVKQRISYLKAKNELERNARDIRNNAFLRNLADDYECVTYVNITGDFDNCALEKLRDSDFISSNLPGWAEANTYNERLRLLSTLITSEKEREDFIAKTEIANVLLQFVTDDSYYVEFAALLNETRCYYQIKYSVEKNEDGVITAVVAGLRNIDDVVESQKELIRLEQERYEQQAFTNLFIDTYTAAYYVNLDDYTYIEYKLKDSLRDRFTKYNDFVRTMANYIKNNVYEEDQEMMYAVSNSDFIKEKLKNSEQYTVV